MFYVYKHLTSNNELFYIGKGKDRRGFKAYGRNAFWNNIVNKHGYRVEIIKYFKDEATAYRFEEYLIKKYKEKMLCRANLSTGGRGGFSGIGTKCSENTKKLISKALKGRKPTEETRLKLKEARKGKKPALGIIRTEDHNRKTALSVSKYCYITPKGIFKLAKDAAKTFGVSDRTIVRWCNKNSKYYKLGFDRCKTPTRR